MVALPIVYGSIAYFMGKKADQYASHKWSLFLRGPNFEDLSCFVAKVVFTLHPSFPSPVREVVDPPYQVSELGWGEFEAGIRVFFRDPNEQPIDLIHHIRLYPPVNESGVQEAQNPKVPVVCEAYDEVVFTAPSETFKRLLMMYTVSQADIHALESGATLGGGSTGMEHYTKFDDDADLAALAAVQDYVAREIDLAKQRLLAVEAEVTAILADPYTVVARPAPPTASGAGAGAGAAGGDAITTAATDGQEAGALSAAAAVAAGAGAGAGGRGGGGNKQQRGGGGDAGVKPPKKMKKVASTSVAPAVAVPMYD
jgi:YEATS domain-containing protein 4